MAFLVSEKKRWKLAPRIGALEQASLATDTLLLAQLLWNRGIRSAADGRQYLAAPSLTGLADPFTMRGMTAAVDVLVGAIEAREPIAVYGDYDVDGVAGAALLVDLLRSLGGRPLIHIPHRVRDGYGLNSQALAALAQQGARVVITVDCGITANAEVDTAAALGLQVIVTDHHTVPSELPSAAAVLNPHQGDCLYPYKEFAGGGVAFQLARALLSTLLPPRQAEERALLLTDLAALSTIADVVPLSGENRTLAALGIATLKAGHRPGLRALCDVAGRSPAELRVRDLSFGLIPRLNAAGRMGDAMDAVNLLLSTDADEAGALAAALDRTNTARRELLSDLLTGAEVEAAEFAGEPAIVIDGPYPIGLAGLLASRLVDRWQVPAVVIQRGDGTLRGSARAPEGYDLMPILAQCAGALIQYGGHPRAAGFTLSADTLDRFRTRFLAGAGQTAQALPSPERAIAVDAALRLHSIGPELADLVERFEPAGEANPPVTFLSRGTILSRERSGHGPTRLRIQDSEAVRQALVFGVEPSLPPDGARVDVCYEVRRDIWQGDQRIALVVCDEGLAATTQPGPPV